MSKNKIIAFTVADEANEKFYKNLKKSWEKFHPDIELKRYKNRPNDPHFFYRATPIIAKELMAKYDTVVKIDADSIVTTDLSHTWKGDFDVAVVQNANPREMDKVEVNVWTIHPLQYVNAGYVVMKSKEFVTHWHAQCHLPHFNAYQYKEQDLLNIIVFYGNYTISFLDASDKFHGLASKGYEPHMIVKKDKLILPKMDEWASDGDKEICIIHFAGGNDPQKGNYKTMFSPEATKFIDKILA